MTSNSAPIAAREDARRPDGEFGTQSHAESGIVQSADQAWDTYLNVGIDVIQDRPVGMVPAGTDTYQGTTIRVALDGQSAGPGFRIDVVTAEPDWAYSDTEGVPRRAVGMREPGLLSKLFRRKPHTAKIRPQTASEVAESVAIDETWKRVAPTGWYPGMATKDEF